MLERISSDCREICKKGTLVYIEGKIKTRSYDDQSGVKRYITEIIADNLELLSKRSGGVENENITGRHDLPVSENTSNEVDNNSDMDDLPF